jgi:hypothetical protein
MNKTTMERTITTSIWKKAKAYLQITPKSETLLKTTNIFSNHLLDNLKITDLQ